MKRKITLFISNLEGGGAERVIATLANEFYGLGHEVDLLLVQERGPYLSELVDGVQVVNLNATRNIYSFFPLVRYLRKEKPEVILATLLPVCIVTVLAKLFSGSGVRVVLREAISPRGDAQFNQGRIEKFIALFREFALKRADKIVSPSHGIASDLIDKYGIDSNRVTVIYNPVDIDKVIEASNQKDPLLDNIGSDVKIILGLGRLNAQKNFSLLIQAYKLASSKADSILIILGEGTERIPLENLIKNEGLSGRVYLPGFRDNPFPFLRRASVFVLSSNYEGLPNALIQATVFGKPTVSTACPTGPSEILEGGKFGCLVEMGDVRALANGILLGLAGKLNIPTKSEVEKKYQATEIAKDYLRVLLD